PAWLAGREAATGGHSPNATPPMVRRRVRPGQFSVDSQHYDSDWLAVRVYESAGRHPLREYESCFQKRLAVCLHWRTTRFPGGLKLRKQTQLRTASGNFAQHS